MEELLKLWPVLVVLFGVAASWGDTKRSMKSHQKATQEGFNGVNSRLDTLNGKVYKHEGDLNRIKGKLEMEE